MALIKENAKKIDARLDPFLEKIDVVAPDYLSISVKKDTDGTYYASPVILNADGSPYGEKDASEFGRKFKNGSKAQRSYMGKDRTYYVFDQEQQDGLQQIKEARKLTKEQAKTLVLSPQSVFTGAPFRFDRGEYSDRVIEYGAFIAKKYPYLNGIEGGWLPEEGSVGREDLDGIDELDEPEVTEENVAIPKELIENAFAKTRSRTDRCGDSRRNGYFRIARYGNSKDRARSRFARNAYRRGRGQPYRRFSRGRNGYRPQRYRRFHNA